MFKHIGVSILVVVLWSPYVSALTCGKLFSRPYGELNGVELQWDNKRTMKGKPYEGVTEYHGVHFIRNGRRIEVQDVLPTVVRDTLGKDMLFNCFSGVMNFFFPGFGLRPLNPQFGGKFHEMQNLLFREVAKEDLQPGDLIVYQVGMAPLEHAAIYLGNNIVWQKPSSQRPAGFFSFSQTTKAMDQFIPENHFRIHYFRFKPGNKRDRFSIQLRADIEKASKTTPEEAQNIMAPWFDELPKEATIH